ncbi:MAG: MATE family efflux transporter, partial [Deltaproteobacteria bacterium]|nr:MATE family efflux transporter [Deltaproteobacteria bacterium]
MSTPIKPAFEQESAEAIQSPTTTAGGVRQVAHLAYPVILTHLSITMMGVVDSAMVGQLGATELAAVGFGGIWLWTLLNGFIGAGIGVQTFVAHDHGAGHPEQCGRWVWQGIYAVIPMTAIAALILHFNADSLMQLLAPSEAVQLLAGEYLAICAFGAVGMCAATILSSFFLGVGDTHTPLYVTLFGLPAWGVSGAAVATTTAEWVYTLVLLVLVSHRARRRAFATSVVAPSMKSIRRLLRVGLPVGGQYAIEMLSFAVFLTLVARLGDASMAASQAFVSLLSLSFMQAEGLSIGVCTLVGRYVGA